MDLNEMFSYSYVHLMPHEQIGVHEQESWELSFVVNGSGSRLIGDANVPFNNGDLVLIPPGIPHCWYFSSDDVDSAGRISNISLMIFGKFLNALKFTFKNLEGSIDKILECNEALSFSRNTSVKIEDILFRMRSMDDRERIAAIINLLILIADDDKIVVGKYIREDKSKKKFDAIKTYIICNSRRSITLDEIASHVGMNKSSFCSFFKRMSGKTFVEYLNEYSIELACRLLKEGEMSISEICYSTGFNDVPYFSKLFKRIKGVSPSNYSKKYKKISLLQ